MVTAEWVGFVSRPGSKAQNCSHMGSMRYGWSAGTEYAPSRREASRTLRMIEYSVSVYMPTRSLLAQPLSLHVTILSLEPLDDDGEAYA